MERADQNRYCEPPQLPDIYQDGFRLTFAVCHDPLPPKMEELVRRLEASGGERPGSQHGAEHYQ